MPSGAKEPLKSMANETARRDKVTFLISSHDLSLFSNPADSCLLLFHGRIICRTGGKIGGGGNQEKYEECRIRSLYEKERQAVFPGH